MSAQQSGKVSAKELAAFEQSALSDLDLESTGADLLSTDLPLGLDMKDLKQVRKGIEKSDDEAQDDDDDDDGSKLHEDLQRVMGLGKKDAKNPVKTQQDKEAAKLEAVKAREAKEQQQFAKKVDAASVVDESAGDEKAIRKVSAMRSIMSSLLIKVRGAMAALSKKKAQVPPTATAQVQKMQGTIEQLDKLVASGAKAVRIKKVLVGAAKLAKEGHKLLQEVDKKDKQRAS